MMKSVKLIPWVIALGLAWSLGFAYNIYKGGLISWLRGMYYNKVALASELKDSPRLLIVGGSGAHYTVNSKFMEEQLGLTVLNLGLDGNVGLNVIFPTMIEQVRPGDIVLLIPEYLLLLDEDGIGERSVSFAVAIAKPGRGDIPPRQFAEDGWLLGIPGVNSLVKSGVDLATKGKIDDYYTDPLTERGDPTKTWYRKSRWRKAGIKKPISNHSVKLITQFKQDVEAKGANLIISLPIFYGSTDEKTLKNVKKTAAELEKIAPLIYDPETLNIWTDSRLFADTNDHLQPHARLERSKQIIRQLQPLLTQINP
jgi:hypothetical protein